MSSDRKLRTPGAVQQGSANGPKLCEESNGTDFYFQLRNRVLALDEYFQSPENLVVLRFF
jgi:hypothetical protein